MMRSSPCHTVAQWSLNERQGNIVSKGYYCVKQLTRSWPARTSALFSSLKKKKERDQEEAEDMARAMPKGPCQGQQALFHLQERKVEENYYWIVEHAEPSYYIGACGQELV